MANIQNIKIGNNNPDAIMFNAPVVDATGDALWDYFKFANDAGGYFVHGLTLMPFSPWGIYSWPWDLGIPSGALKDDNNGAHYWGYVNDGIGKNITNGINKTFPANVAGAYGFAIAVYGTANYTDADGGTWLDFGDVPIVIEFLDDRFDDVTWTVKNSAVVNISEDKRTITIHKIKVGNSKDNFIALVGYTADKAIESVRTKMVDVYANVTGLTYHKKVISILNVASEECWDAYLGGEHIYHKDKTMTNCWRKYGVLSDVTDDNGSTIAYSVNRTGIDNSINAINIPETVDYKDFMLPTIESGIIPVTFNTSLKSSPNLLQGIKNFLNVHPFHIDNAPKYDEYGAIISETILPTSSNITAFCNLLKTNDYIGDLTVKIGGNSKYLFLPYLFSRNIIDKLTIVAMNDDIKISSAQFLFKTTTIKEIEIVDVNGNKYNNLIKSIDCSGMCEMSKGFKVFPDIVNWALRKGCGSKYLNPIQFAFSYCSDLEVIEQRGEDRYNYANIIYVFPYFCQSFQACSKLKTIGPVLDVKYVNFAKVINNNSNTPGYKVFEGCGNLTDVRIRNLNGSYVNFANNAQHGYLTGLDADSIKYLFDNLTDMNTYAEGTYEETGNNSWYKWNGNKHNQSSIDIDTITITLRKSSSMDDYNITNIQDDAFAWTQDDAFAWTQDGNVDTDIIVSGLYAEDALMWYMISDGVVTSQRLVNGENHISGFGYLCLRQTQEVQEEVNDTEHPVTVTFKISYVQGAPFAPTAELHCPATWFEHTDANGNIVTSKVTNQMLVDATNKNWQIFNGDTQVYANK